MTENSVNALQSHDSGGRRKLVLLLSWAILMALELAVRGVIAAPLDTMEFYTQCASFEALVQKG